MLTKQIEVIRVETRLVGAFKPFTHLKIENTKTQAACRIPIFYCLSKPQPVAAYFRMDDWARRRFRP
jgi:hypothetical protein